MFYMAIKEIQVDIPDWCDGCLSFDLSVKERTSRGEKIFTCSNLAYCIKAKKAYEEAIGNGVQGVQRA